MSPRTTRVKTRKKTTSDVKRKSEEPRKSNGSERTSSVERAFLILEELASPENMSGLKFTDIKEKLHSRERIPNGTLSNLLRTLNRLGYVHFDERNRLHSLGLQLIKLGEMANRRVQEYGREDCVELLRRVIEKTERGAHIAILDSGDALYLLREDTPHFIGPRIFPGRRQVPHLTAVGKALICCLDEDRVKEILDLHRNPKSTRYSMTELDKLMPHLAEVEKVGYAIDDQEHELGVRCVAAPIYSAPRRVIASIGISTTAEDVTLDQLKEIGAQVLKPAAEEAANTPRILNVLKKYYSISNNPRNG